MGTSVEHYKSISPSLKERITFPRTCHVTKRTSHLSSHHLSSMLKINCFDNSCINRTHVNKNNVDDVKPDVSLGLSVKLITTNIYIYIDDYNCEQ